MSYIVVGSVLLAIGLIGALAWCDSRDDADFHSRCLASGFSEAKCEILGEEHADARDAQEAAGFAIGMAASGSARAAR
jgi:hypothetical protein